MRDFLTFSGTFSPVKLGESKAEMEILFQREESLKSWKNSPSVVSGLPIASCLPLASVTNEEMESYIILLTPQPSSITASMYSACRPCIPCWLWSEGLRPIATSWLPMLHSVWLHLPGRRALLCSAPISRQRMERTCAKV